MKLGLTSSFSLFIGLIIQIISGDDDTCYAAFCDDVISSCRDFDNNVLNCDGIQFQPGNGSNGEEMYLNGFISIKKELGKDVTLLLEVAKETEVGDEPVSSFAVGLCDSLEKEDAPWAGVVKEMELTGCPVEAGDYYLSNLVLSLGSMKLTQDMCGDYQAKFSMMKETQKLSCHIISLVVNEVPCE